MKHNRVMLIDAETRWSQGDYSLSKMTTEEYIRDPRFKAFGFCYKRLDEDTAPVWVPHAKLPAFFASIDWSRTAVMAHNAMFDAAILSWVYGHVPAFIFDTLSMARALRGAEGGNSLARLAEEFGLPPKGKAVHSTSGVDELTPEMEAELAAYCAHDVVLLEGVFRRLFELAGPTGFPTKELRIIDMVMRMYVDPKIELDEAMLRDAITAEDKARTDLLASLSVDETELASDARFADMLRTLGVEPPTKVSKTTGKEAYAFAKNDALFQALLQHDDERVSLLCEARIKVKSTQARTRAQRFADIATRGTLPVPLYYSAAHTHRIQAAKGQGINLQNLKRGSFLRRAMVAPLDTRFVVVDLSQIEPRVLAWLAGYDELLDIFRSGKDAYAQFGAQMFGVSGLTKESHPELRQSAKSALLGAGYNLGWASFAAQLLTGFLGAPPMRYDKAFAKKLGVTARTVAEFVSYEPNVERALAIPHTCSTEELLIHCVCAKEIITRYRTAAKRVTGLWELCNALIERSLYGGVDYDLKCVTFTHERIMLPSGLALRYPNLKAEPDPAGRVQWTYGEPIDPSGGKVRREKLYGGKCVENIVQAVARCVMTDGMLRIQKRYPCVLTVHDEAVLLVPAAEADDALPWAIEQMTKEPAYMPGIPLAAEGGTSARYGDAKK